MPRTGALYAGFDSLPRYLTNRSPQNPGFMGYGITEDHGRTCVMARRHHMKDATVYALGALVMAFASACMFLFIMVTA